MIHFIKKNSFSKIAILLALFLLVFLLFFIKFSQKETQNNSKTIKNLITSARNESNENSIKLKDPLPAKTILNNSQVFQTFNNCGPASFSMLLSYYGVDKTQQELGEELRPYQNPQGDNDDKSVSLEEIAKKSKDFGFTAYRRPLGDINLIKYFITYDFPVLTRTWLKQNEDIGHYRVVKGYDDNRKVIIQDDSMEGKNIEYHYESFLNLWNKFNYEYLVLVPNEKKEIADAILGENKDELVSWENAVEKAKKDLDENPNDIYSRFNLSVALTNSGQDEQAVSEYKKVEDKLSFRTLWYQVEPILSYYRLKNYNRVFEISNKIISNSNRAYSELYIIRGKIYLEQNNKQAARSEFEKAVFYNKNLKEAQALFDSVN